MKTIFKTISHSTLTVARLMGYLSFLCLLVLSITLTKPLVYASTVVESNPIAPLDTPTTPSTNSSSSSNKPIEDYAQTGELPSVSVENATDFISSKLYDIVTFLQIIAKPLAVVGVVICGLMALFGAFGDSGLTQKGIAGIVIIGICYFAITFAPELLDAMTNWMSEGSEVLVQQ